MNGNNSTIRFSNRVNDYKKYRPHYPEEVIDFLQKDYGITPQNIVADIGAGTGISSRLFLYNDYTVIAVEPNAEMRQAAIDDLHQFKKFSATAGTAENTLLQDKTVDIIVAAQAFHWFDPSSVKKEFKRILKPNGLVVLLWNERLTNTDFEKEYDQLIVKHAIDYVQIDHRNIDYDNIKRFFAPATCELKIFPNYQLFDLDGLKGRLLSSSYIPQPGSDGHNEMITDLESLFEKYKENNSIRIMYDTKVYVSRWDK